LKLGRELFQFVFVLGLTKIGRELELDGLLLLLLLLGRHLMITLLLLFGRGLLGLLLISLLMTLLLLFGKYVRLTDVRPSETEKDLLELE
jgi:hypothetical protein